MTKRSQAVITTAEERPRDEWNDPIHGRVSWHTLFSSDITPTDSMSAGVAELVSGGELRPHRHEQPEIYFILEGTGIVRIDGHETVVKAGTAVFIPGNAEHGIRNDSDANLKLFYAFPTGSFADVVYRFPDN
jgi:quercetin dioxygenase-like cupin family protein